MVTTFRKHLENKAASEINPELYVDRAIQHRVNVVLDVLGTCALFAMGGFFFAVWLAYEGWITPDTFKGIL